VGILVMSASISCNKDVGRSSIAVKIGALAVAVMLLSACAAPGNSSTMALRDPLVTGCPPGSLLTCEVIGGNKFQKRYGRCICAAR